MANESSNFPLCNHHPVRRLSFFNIVLDLTGPRKLWKGAGVGSLWEVLLGEAWGGLWSFLEALGEKMKSYLALGDISVSVPLFHKH